MDFQSKLIQNKRDILHIYVYIRTYQSKISRDLRIAFNALYLYYRLMSDIFQMGEGPSLFFAITKLKNEKNGLGTRLGRPIDGREVPPG